MNLRLLAWIVLPVVGLIIVGWIAVKLLAVLFGWVIYLALGAAVVAGAVYLYGKAKKALGRGSSHRSLPR